MKIAGLILLGAFALGVSASAQAAPLAPKLEAPGVATAVAHTVKHVKKKKPRHHAHAHHAHKHSAAHVHAKHKAHPHKRHKVKKVKH